MLITSKFILLAHTRLQQLIPMYSTSCHPLLPEYPWTSGIIVENWAHCSFLFPHWPIKTHPLLFSFWILSTSSELPLAQMEHLWELEEYAPSTLLSSLFNKSLNMQILSKKTLYYYWPEIFHNKYINLWCLRVECCAVPKFFSHRWRPDHFT